MPATVLTWLAGLPSRLNWPAVRTTLKVLAFLLAFALSSGCREEHRYRRQQAATRAEENQKLQEADSAAAQAARWTRFAERAYRAGDAATDSANHYHQLAQDALNTPISIADTSRLHRILAEFDWRTGPAAPGQ